jgi:hypothetical protein
VNLQSVAALPARSLLLLRQHLSLHHSGTLLHAPGVQVVSRACLHTCTHWVMFPSGLPGSLSCSLLLLEASQVAKLLHKPHTTQLHQADSCTAQLSAVVVAAAPQTRLQEQQGQAPARVSL